MVSGSEKTAAKSALLLRLAAKLFREVFLKRQALHKHFVFLVISHRHLHDFVKAPAGIEHKDHHHHQKGGDSKARPTENKRKAQHQGGHREQRKDHQTREPASINRPGSKGDGQNNGKEDDLRGGVIANVNRKNHARQRPNNARHNRKHHPGAHPEVNSCVTVAVRPKPAVEIHGAV